MVLRLNYSTFYLLLCMKFYNIYSFKVYLCFIRVLLVDHDWLLTPVCLSVSMVNCKRLRFVHERSRTEISHWLRGSCSDCSKKKILWQNISAPSVPYGDFTLTKKAQSIITHFQTLFLSQSAAPGAGTGFLCIIVSLFYLAAGIKPIPGWDRPRFWPRSLPHRATKSHLSSHRAIPHPSSHCWPGKPAPALPFLWTKLEIKGTATTTIARSCGPFKNPDLSGS